MVKQKSIKMNMVMSIILTSSNFIFPIITYSYVARVLLPVGTGKVAFVQSVLAYFAYIAALGISGYGIRECAKVRDDKEALSKLTQELLMINICATILAYAVLILTVLAVPKFREYKVLFIVMSISILLQTLGMEWIYNALEQYTYITIRSLIFKIIAVVLTFLLIKSPDDYVIYGVITIFATSASNILNFINVRKYITFRRFKEYRLKYHLKPIMFFFMSTIIISVYGHFDSVMLGFMKGDSEVGVYNAALKMKLIILSVSTAVTSVLIPRMSLHIAKGDIKRFNQLLLKSLQVSMMLVVPLAAFVMLNAMDVLLFVCGKEYTSAKPTLIILMACVFALMITNLLGNQILIPKGNEKRYSTSVLIGMFLNLLLNTVLIPKFASLGAAVATLITECFNVFWMGGSCQEEIHYLKNNLNYKKYAAALAGALCLELISMRVMSSSSLFLRLCFNTMVLFISYFAILLVQKEAFAVQALHLVINKLKSIRKKS